MRNYPTGNDESNFVSEVSMSILLLVIFTKESNLFLVKFIFKQAQINLLTFLSPSDFRIFFLSELLTVPDGSSHF